MTSLVFDPWVAQRIWRRAMVGARQPLKVGFELDSISIDGVAAPVRETSEPLGPLAELRRFVVEPIATDPACAASRKRSVLLVPPLSGAFSVTVRDIAALLLQDADVSVVEWRNVGQALTEAPWFDFDDQIDRIVEAMRRLGPEAHVVAVCQAGPPSVIAAAALGDEDAASAPASLTAIGAPLQPTAAPSPVSQSIRDRSFQWYRRRLTKRIDLASGVQREVYPAEAQLSILMSTLATQSPSRDELSRMISRDDGDAPHRLSFLDIVTGFMDVPAEHFLSSLDRIYLSDEGPLAPMRWRDRAIPLDALKGVAMAAIEGENDRVAAPGQTASMIAATPAEDGVARRRHVVSGLGHFGLFYGSGWRDSVAPRVVALMRHAERARRRKEIAAELAAAEAEAPVAVEEPAYEPRVAGFTA